MSEELKGAEKASLAEAVINILEVNGIIPGGLLKGSVVEQLSVLLVATDIVDLLGAPDEK